MKEIKRYTCVKCNKTGNHRRFRYSLPECLGREMVCNTCIAGSPFFRYIRRNKFLHDLGFSSYSHYLKSEMWAVIRQMVLNRDNGNCKECGKIATNVHHQSYELEVLIGLKLDKLVSLCSNCHKNVEFDKNGEKRDFLMCEEN